jgi:starch synthase (maltosyl-transferring)
MAALRRPALDPHLRRRVVVERVRPEVDGGRFPIKRVTGEVVVVRADVFADGHDRVAAAVKHRRVGAVEWTVVPMEALGNDRWRAAFTVGATGRYEYTVEGWVDRFGSWKQELAKKIGAGQDVTSELLEGAGLIRSLLPAMSDPLRIRDLLEWATLIGNERAALSERVTAALAPALEEGLRRGDRGEVTRYDRTLGVLVERARARTGAWYEMFPRSAGADPARSATFDEATALLPYVASMGFDVLYLPPIHPIGRSFRKGANNALQAAPGDPGSPWAIGAAEGGHTAVEPGLGTLADFDRFVDAARRHGLEIALDLAYQASPDHPYVADHPEWFRRRPDGTIKYAENPPKKYQDIYPFDFEAEAWEPLWLELKQIVEFWLTRGIRIFRVDNPHTKPFRFWAWMLAELRAGYPDAIFLSEAFTRPKIMRYLAKAGFSQSYTYFTWRNTAQELREYFTELTQTEVREYFRPNLFANTPDILHAYLQRGGRPAFQARLILAATLGASYGIYSGFELVERVPVREGSEEYLDSEKYQVRVRDYSRPDSLAELAGRVNAIRRDHPALQQDWTLRFHDTDNPHLLAYSKRSPDGADLLLMVVNLDPFAMQHGYLRLPLEAWGLAPDGAVEVLDLLSDERYFWRGEWNYVRLDPQVRVAHILRVDLAGPLPPEPDRDDD